MLINLSQRYVYLFMIKTAPNFWKLVMKNVLFIYNITISDKKIK